jgi:hypothetical protein
MTECIRAADRGLAECLRNTGNGGLESWAFDTVIPWLVHDFTLPDQPIPPGPPSH